MPEEKRPRAGKIFLDAGRAGFLRREQIYAGRRNLCQGLAFLCVCGLANPGSVMPGCGEKFLFPEKI
jgi:hypothetical protein